MALTQVQPGMLGTPQPNNFKNRIINGAMVIDQRNAGAAVTMSANPLYTLDRWGSFVGIASGGIVTTVQQVDIGLAGFSKALKVGVSTGGTMSGDDYKAITQVIEGYNIADFGWGTANAKAVTLSFWVYSSVAGIYTINLINQPSYNYGLSVNYTINAANTWEYKTITIAGPTSGTWGSTNGAAVRVWFGLGASGAYLGNATNTWGSGASVLFQSGGANFLGTTGNAIYFTGVQLEVGTTATNFDFRPYGTELALCQRYYSKSFSTEIAPANGRSYDTAQDFTAATYAGNEAWLNMAKYPVTMRTAPSITFYSTSLGTTDGKWTAYTSSSWAALGANAVVMNNSDGFSTSASRAGGWSANQGVMILGHWAASAEL